MQSYDYALGIQNERKKIFHFPTIPPIIPIIPILLIIPIIPINPIFPTFPTAQKKSPPGGIPPGGLTEDGGDLLSRIAVQYHRRARA